MARQIVVHGHFYQPPRENPWTGEVEAQPGAAPFHNWNERILAECYRPNTHATIPAGSDERVVNNFERLSFDIGPTLLAWLEPADPDTYGRIIEADRVSAAALGHGNAMAQAYHHTILPLSPVRDVRTQVRWGIADFRHRFGRDPEGMWLPEAAVDDDTLGVLIDEGIAFTLLATHQGRVSDGSQPGREPDSAIPYRYMHRDGSGRSLALFFYDEEISHAIAFENAGSSSEGFIDLFESRARDGGLVHAATDGETYGHHHEFSDLGLAYALWVEAPGRGLEITNYGRHLADRPPEDEVRIVPESSWSCAHGVARWRADCGCRTGGEEGWRQAWRGPLRGGLEMIRNAADAAFEQLGGVLFSDPWGARDRYIEVVLGSTPLDEFTAREASGPLDASAIAQAGLVLELQRNALSMFTSCGWFFSDVGGIETIQVLAYAARVLDLLDELGRPADLTGIAAELEQAESNDPDIGTAADLLRAVLDQRAPLSPRPRSHRLS